MYLTFQEYTAMGGALTSAAFTRAEFAAEKQIDKYTFGRLQTLATQTDAVKNLTFELVELDSKATDAAESGIKSEGIGSYSVSYATATETQNAVYALICDYLACETLADGTPYLYRGC